jgi:diaminopimelate decarboxylase
MMNTFQRHGSELYCENVALHALAQEFGTPAYVYSKASICSNINTFQSVFSSIDMQLCFSIKSNSNLSILKLVAQQGAGADIVSGGELFRALKAGIAPAGIVYSGVGKTEHELRYALESGIRMFNIESEPELDQLASVAQSLQKTAHISLRVNPDIDANTHAKTTTGKKENKFGLLFDSAAAIYKKAQNLPYIDPVGIDVHLGSPILSLEPYERALKLLSGLITDLRASGIAIRTLDIGGGFGITYNNEVPFTPAQFAELVIPYTKSLQCNLVIEPGRFIMGNSGVLLTSITYIKQTSAKLFYICDAGMNDLIRPALYGSFHNVAPVVLPKTDAIDVADIVGPICESSDCFAKERSVPRMQQHDVLAILSAGAYGFSMSSNYNSRPRACEILVDGAAATCIRKRETYEDIIRNEE